MSAARNVGLAESAPAKINLTLRVLARRSDGYHTLESLVVFADFADRLRFAPGGALALAVRGPNAAAAGPVADNLVLKAARALAAEVPDLKLGRFTLTKQLPAAAGIGGGSADAAAALRLLAHANRLRLDDPRLRKAARKVGADVPVCIDPRPRLMRGVGDILSAPLAIPRLPAVLVNPGVALATKDVFAVLGLSPGQRARASRPARIPRARDALLDFIASGSNDLEPPAIELRPVIARALTALRAAPGCRLARMSGSGATCFGLFDSSRGAASAARALAASNPRWWVRATVLG
jgi:4-diphosphocytidyl-2-C-methyl-D-erythritol kinase